MRGLHATAHRPTRCGQRREGQPHGGRAREDRTDMGVGEGRDRRGTGGGDHNGRLGLGGGREKGGALDGNRGQGHVKSGSHESVG